MFKVQGFGASGLEPGADSAGSLLAGSWALGGKASLLYVWFRSLVWGVP